MKSRYSLLDRLQRLADNISESLEAGVTGIRDLEEVNAVFPDILQAVKERDDLRGLVAQLQVQQHEKVLVGTPTEVPPLRIPDVVCDGPYFAPPPPITGDFQFTCGIHSEGCTGPGVWPSHGV